MRHQMIEAIQADQMAGLTKWVEYLGGDDGGYPDWFKIYAWESVVKLGNYDKEKQEFQKRSRGTTSPYPELNREALAYVYDALNKSRVQGEKTDGETNDVRLQGLLKTGNFAKLYAYAVLEATPDSPELKKDIRGSWTKFNQTDDPRTARRLSGSLQGHGTGWCTAGESTASTQLSGGDFFVYYTRDEEGKDTVPRIAIRMEEGEVAEVRGVNASQELEPEMADIAAEQLKELPGGEEYIHKAEDMKRLTAIEKKIAANSETDLSDQELSFLYELDHDIEGFGYGTDPRIGEIRSQRGDKDKPELARILSESIREQLQSAYTAYSTVIKQLGHEAESQEDLEQLLAAKNKEWQDKGIYSYLVEKLVADGVRFTLIATPNIEASEAQIVALAEDFGEGQTDRLHMSDTVYGNGYYSGRELSGCNIDESPIRFSLIPNRLASEIGRKRVSEQVRLLRELQTIRPELSIRVPSLLDAVMYWYSLRAGGDKLNDSGVNDRTYINHFDLEPKLISGRVPDVLASWVNNNSFGGPILTSYGAWDGFPVRLAVG